MKKLQKKSFLQTFLIIIVFLIISGEFYMNLINSHSKNDTSILEIETLVQNPQTFLHKEIQITGTLILTGKNYFIDPNFALTDGTNKFQITTWVPLEFPPPILTAKGKQPSTMTTYLNKTVTLQGTVEQNDQGFILIVSKAL